MSAQLADPSLVMALVPDNDEPVFSFTDRWRMSVANKGLESLRKPAVTEGLLLTIDKIKRIG